MSWVSSIKVTGNKVHVTPARIDACFKQPGPSEIGGLLKYLVPIQEYCTHVCEVVYIITYCRSRSIAVAIPCLSCKQVSRSHPPSLDPFFSNDVDLFFWNSWQCFILLSLVLKATTTAIELSNSAPKPIPVLPQYQNGRCGPLHRGNRKDQISNVPTRTEWFSHLALYSGMRTADRLLSVRWRRLT